MTARLRRLAPGVAPEGDVPAPHSAQVGPRSLRLGDAHAATLAVTGYPAEVGPGWLDPLLHWPGHVDVAVHIQPIPTPVAGDLLRRQRARLESELRLDAERGRLQNLEAAAASDDAHELAGRIARGGSRLFRVGIYLTVYAATEAELATSCAEVRAVAAGLLLEAHPTTFRALQGWTSTLPLAVDSIRTTRVIDTDALAAGFPFSSPDPPLPDGPTAVLYGRNTASAGLVAHDRWALENHNSVTLAASGAGKSYLTKLEALRSLYAGVRVAVIDPEDEYTRLADAVGGTIVGLGAAGVRLNPLDLPSDPPPDRDAFTDRALFAHTLAATLLGTTLTPAEAAALDTAVLAAYHQAGITADPATWARPAPLLSDLTTQLERAGATGSELVAWLAPYVSGSHRRLFDGPTTTRPDGQLLVFALRRLPDELKPAGMLLVLDAIWTRITTTAGSPIRNLVVVDEAWLLMHHPAGAGFLYRLAKSARKHGAGLAVVTQDAADLLGSDLGRAVVANAATQILLRTAPQAIDAVADTWGLSAGERAYLLSAGRGDGLLVASGTRVGFQALASPAEHELVHTDPRNEQGPVPPDRAGRR